jgi:hypothetical protein
VKNEMPIGSSTRSHSTGHGVRSFQVPTNRFAYLNQASRPRFDTIDASSHSLRRRPPVPDPICTAAV